MPVGVIGSDHKRRYLEQFNPDAIIDKSQENLWQRAEEIAPEGFHLIFDANGFSTMKDSYQHLCPMGKLIVYGSHDLMSKKGGRLNYLKAAMGLLRTPRFAPLGMISDNRGVIGFNLSFLFNQKALIAESIEALMKLSDAGKIAPLPTTRIDFKDVAKAHAFIESGRSTGKIVLVI